MQILFPAGSTLNVNSVMQALQLAWKYLQNMDPDDEEQVMIQQDLIGFFNSVPHSRICSALQLMTFKLQEHFGQPASGRLDLSGGPQNRYPRIENLQRATQIPRIQHQGATDSTCHGTDRVLAAVRVLEGRARHLLSDSRSMHGISIGTCSLCIGCSRTGVSDDSKLAHTSC